MLVTYFMKPKEGRNYLETANSFVSESCASPVSDDFNSVDAHVYHIDPEGEQMKIAYPIQLFGGDASMTCSFFNLSIGNNRCSLAEV